jgi:3-hydroxyisobutyrate dehydrogenase-like beta-hydroxyacid dehydrogenase
LLYNRPDGTGGGKVQRNETCAVIGLGNMGIEVASRLAHAGPVTGFDLSPERGRLAAARGLAVAPDLAAAVRGASAVVLSLPTPAASRASVAAIAGLLPANAVVIETSTVTPADVAHMHGLCTGVGLHFVDAAIQSGVEIMARGDSVLLIGGAAEALGRAKPWLDALSPKQSLMGTTGAGAAAKVINNAVAHGVYVVLAEALAMARANGISTENFVAMMSGPDAGLVRPLTHRIGERVARRNFAPGMPLDAARKDSVLALEVAQRDGIPLFAIQGAHTAYELACARGLGREDYAVLATLWDKWLVSNA